MSRIPITQAPGLLPQLRLHASAAYEAGSDLYVYEIVSTDLGMAASASNHTVKFFDRGTLQATGTLAHHSDQVTQMRARPNSLLTSSLDGQIAIWDLRQPLGAPALGFRASDPLLSFDLGNDERLLVGGARLDEDMHLSRISFWDTRGSGTQAVRVFESMHSDDVTQIHCGAHDGRVLSASTDGLVCTFDPAQEEDDAVLAVANTGASVARCGFFGPDEQYVYAQSDMETLQLWSDDATLLADFGDVRAVAGSGVPVDYMAGFRYDAATQRLFMAAGTDAGDLHVFHVGAGLLEHAQVLAGGHSAIVRAFDWDAHAGWAATGGEDGRLSVWAAAQ
ncbi:hypothetical protein LPJ66_001640 [Kickxella alabastrina]|uniref:Uncharacterized protein n=1 Tax=Kickxella alabastrina TaxID=61397 RepID=A0ACC1ISZ6_9FUNG|nr:hypothetical protein LPJ66_001640 [Kickxella alabastrina]